MGWPRRSRKPLQDNIEWISVAPENTLNPEQPTSLLEFGDKKAVRRGVLYRTLTWSRKAARPRSTTQRGKREWIPGLSQLPPSNQQKCSHLPNQQQGRGWGASTLTAKVKNKVNCGSEKVNRWHKHGFKWETWFQEMIPGVNWKR